MQERTHVCLHLLARVRVEEQLCLLISLDLDSSLSDERRWTEKLSRRTKSFLLTQPSSRAGSSTPLSNAIARNAPSASWNSANPNPCGLFAGVISRLKD